MVKRIGGKCSTPDSTTEHDFGQDSEIWKGPKFNTPQFVKLGMSIPGRLSLKLCLGMVHQNPTMERP